MKHFLISLLVLLVASTTGKAQVIRDAGDTTRLHQELRVAFSTLDPNRTSTHILMDQVVAISCATTASSTCL